LRPLSLDIRQRVIVAYNSGKYSMKEVAARFLIGRSTVLKLVHQCHETGSVAPLKVGARALPIWTDEATHEIVRHMVAENNDRTLAEYCDLLEEQSGVRISISQMCKLLFQLKLFRKKKPRGRPKSIAKK